MQNSKKSNSPSGNPAKSDKKSLVSENLRLNSLLEISASINAIRDIKDLVTHIENLFCQHLQAERCNVFLVDKTTGEIWPAAASNRRRDNRKSVGKGIIRTVSASGEKVNIRDVYTNHRFDPEVDMVKNIKIQSMLVVPVFDRDENVIAVVQALNSRENVFSEQDEELAVSILQFAGVALENVILTSDLHKSLVSFVETLSASLDARDYITSGHSRRVTLYAVHIARMMRLDQKEIEKIRYAALLHDIGKIGVPEIVLFKNKELNEEEYEIIKQHASLSKSILNRIHFEQGLKDIPETAASHHEKINGSGYPNGLKGNEIPMGGKILAVCDVFDALTSRRQHRDRMDVDEVVSLLDKETGTTFEPYVVYQFKNIRLNVLVEIMEFGYNENLKKEDMEILKACTLTDLIQIHADGAKSEQQGTVDKVFMKYYLRNYRLS